MGGELSVAEQLALLTPEQLDVVLAGLSDDEKSQMLWDWTVWARPKQLPPDGAWRV